MIERPPRSATELAPSLRAISSLVIETLAEPEAPSRPVWSVRQVWISALASILLALLTAHLSVALVHGRIEAVSPHAIKAAEDRNQAKLIEDEAQDLRALAASGKHGTVKPGGWSHSPRSALRRAKYLDKKSADVRKQAAFHDRLSLGLPVR